VRIYVLVVRGRPDMAFCTAQDARKALTELMDRDPSAAPEIVSVQLYGLKWR